MKKLWFCTAIAVLLLTVATVTAQEQNNLRTWNVHETGQELEAELVSYDSESGAVVLRDEAGGHVELQASQLHISDRRYLSRQTAKQKREQRRQASSSDPIDRAPTRNSGDRSGKHRYAIDWHQTPASAAQAALGKEAPTDDKPVIWFRVLGDLSGYM